MDISTEVAPPIASPDRPSVAKSLGIIDRIKACPFWVKSSDCGCGMNRCAIGKGRKGVVAHCDCEACLDANDLGAARSPQSTYLPPMR